MAKTIQKCEYCGFCTKNVYIFKRHKLRCRKDHGIVRPKKAAMDQQLNDPNHQEASWQGPSTEVVDLVETGTENSIPKSSEIMEEEPENDDGSQWKKERPAVNRNYACSKCEFRTNQSRAFLYHMIEVHKSKFDIFACSICEYCTRYRHKVQRHSKFAHKIILQYDEVQTEYVSSDKAKEGPVRVVQKKPKKSLMSKGMAGRKLMVKFMKKDKGENIKKQLKAPMFNMKKTVQKPSENPTSNENSGQFSKVVEETVGENGEVMFKCKECQFISDDEQKVAKHAVSWHVDTKSYSCANCDYISFERSDFLAHRSKHRDEHHYKCDECTFSSNFKPNYERHRQNHQLSLAHKCPICTYSSGSESSIKRHITMSHDTVPPEYEKEETPVPKSQSSTVKSTDDEDSNSMTSKTLSEVSPGDSPTSKASPYSVSNSSLQSNASLLFNINFDPSSASMVPRRTLPPPNMESMKLLMKELSPMRKLPPNISKYVKHDNGKLVCPACKLKYKRSSDLNRHMKRKHGCKLREYLESDKAFPPLSLTDDTDDSLIDGYGGDLLNMEDDNDADDVDDDGSFMDQDETGEEENASNADQNESLMRSDGESPSFSPESLKCKYCTFKAKWPSDLRRHMAVHSIEKRFQCSYCPRKYKYIGDMNVHIRKDHNKEPGDVKVVKVATIPRKKMSPALFKCPCCSYTSAWKSEIDRHTRQHTGDKTFQCCHCTYQTFWRGDIRRHVYKHHPDLMKDGVAIDDVINIMKKTPEKKDDDKEKETSPFKDEMNIKESSPESMEVEAMQMPDSLTLVRSIKSPTEDSDPARSKSPTPSPVKDLGGGLFRCEHCGFAANAPSKMNSHMATHTNIKRYICPLCGKRANWKWDISKHIRRDHNDQVTQVVKLSRQAAEDTIKEYMKTNVVVKREHHLNRLDNDEEQVDGFSQYYKCSRCLYSDERRVSVARHINLKHRTQETQILLVKTCTNKQESLDENVKQLYDASSPMGVSPATATKLTETTGTPDTGRPFMCSECGKKGATKGDIKKHYHYLHADKEIRIIYLGDGSQSVYSPKSEVLQSKPNESPSQFIKIEDSPEKFDKQPLGLSPSRTPNSGLLPTVEPKALGYIRPFQCGYCGRRSNWKWDLSKHIRERHPGRELKIITLSEDEARATVQDYVEQQMPILNKVSYSVPRVRKGKSPSPSKEGSPGMVGNYLQEHYDNSSEPIDHTVGMDLSDTAIDVDNTPLKGSHRHFKCSHCTYKSNWKADVQRHIGRKHKDDGSFVIILKKDIDEATLEGYQFKQDEARDQCEGDLREAGQVVDIKSAPRPLPKKTWGSLMRKYWRCIMCPYSNEDKVDVLKHLLGKHNMKAYRCTLCNWTANFRSGVYRHIQSKHPGEKNAFCRLGIKLIKENPGSNDMGQTFVSPLSSSTSPKPKPNQPSIEDFMRAPQPPPVSDGENVNKTRKIVYHCKLCTEFRSKWRSCVCRHLRQAHDNRDYTANCVKKIIKVPLTQSENTVSSHTSSPAKSSSDQPKPPRSKNFACSLCPYRSYKAKMLRFHERCHTPQPGVKQLKCKHCPYYVNRNRLLSQHTILHMKGYKSQNDGAHKPSPVKSGRSSENSPAGPKRHRCEKCPYTSNSKNDFLYHKQFHRPKPTADYKCDYCEYWVTHRRLLKQHMKVHSEAPDYIFEETTPTKVEHSENAYVYDTVEIAEIKQRIIASKITASISQSPIVSPMKIASGCSMGGKRGFLRKDGTYRKIHRCHHCPYMNVRLRNMRLHELMHGKRTANHVLIKCPHCDYHVGSKGLLAHHLKVHQPNYDMVMLGLENERRDSLASEDCEMDANISMDNKVDSLLEIARYKKYGCEKCPYASAKKNRFQKHVELHGSKQKCKCDYCDYSVPSANLLQQHLKLHFEPNQNLLAAQTIHNLQHLPEMPADVALASMMTNNDSKHPVSITHDHIDLFENAPDDAEPKKIYRCDRCPYANVRRDNLLAHLRCHMTKNEYVCPYCDYSVGKTHVLVQHVKVHFSPLPELSDWLTENGDQQRMKEVKEKNITEVLEVTKMLQADKQKGNKKCTGKPGEEAFVDQAAAGRVKQGADQNDKKNKEKDEQTRDTGKAGRTEAGMDVDDNGNLSKNGMDKVKSEKEQKSEAQDKENGTNGQSLEGYVCQYCDRDFSSSKLLVQHELQHLVGNSYEDMVSQLLEAASVLEKKDNTSAEDKPSQRHVAPVLNDRITDNHVTSEAGTEGVFIVNQKGEKIAEMTPAKQRKRTVDGEIVGDTGRTKRTIVLMNTE